MQKLQHHSTFDQRPGSVRSDQFLPDPASFGTVQFQGSALDAGDILDGISRAPVASPIQDPATIQPLLAVTTAMQGTSSKSGIIERLYSLHLCVAVEQPKLAAEFTSRRPRKRTAHACQACHSKKKKVRGSPPNLSLSF